MEKIENCKIAVEYICNRDICKLQQSTFAIEIFAKLNGKKILSSLMANKWENKIENEDTNDHECQI
jgi:hypothetical protein